MMKFAAGPHLPVPSPLLRKADLKADRIGWGGYLAAACLIVITVEIFAHVMTHEFIAEQGGSVLKGKDR